MSDALNASQPGADALAVLRSRANATGDAALIAAVAAAERAHEKLALERASLQSRLTASATKAETELSKLRTLGLSTVSAPWEEGTGAGDLKPGECCYNWAELRKRRWAGGEVYRAAGTGSSTTNGTSGCTSAFSSSTTCGDGTPSSFQPRKW